MCCILFYYPSSDLLSENYYSLAGTILVYFRHNNFADKEQIDKVFKKCQPAVLVHLATQAGVGYDITNPDVYIENNFIGFCNILGACRHYSIEHLVYASSLSVYRTDKRFPKVQMAKWIILYPIYAATKVQDELKVYAHSRLYSISSAGLRSFAIYGLIEHMDRLYSGF